MMLLSLFRVPKLMYRIAKARAVLTQIRAQTPESLVCTIYLPMSATEARLCARGYDVLVSNKPLRARCQTFDYSQVSPVAGYSNVFLLDPTDEQILICRNKLTTNDSPLIIVCRAVNRDEHGNPTT